ncbi:MAG: 30S ribosomal protein S18 [Candidatus Andersenbacteria bacterium]
MMQKQQRKYPTECVMCAEKLQQIPMQDTELLRKFMSGQNKILPRRKTGACAKHQRVISREIKRGRDMGILRFRGQ